MQLYFSLLVKNETRKKKKLLCCQMSPKIKFLNLDNLLPSLMLCFRGGN